LVAAIRDEAHRFAITYHRKQRGKITSALDDVAGVGPSRRRAVLRHFGSLSALRAASREDLLAMPGLPKAVAEAIYLWVCPPVVAGEPEGDGRDPQQPT
jgi:excinuclease ABC subunit C